MVIKAPRAPGAGRRGEQAVRERHSRGGKGGVVHVVPALESASPEARTVEGTTHLTGEVAVLEDRWSSRHGGDGVGTTGPGDGQVLEVQRVRRAACWDGDSGS